MTNRIFETEELLRLLDAVSDEITQLGKAATMEVKKMVTVDGTAEGKLDAAKLADEQRATFSLAWLATTIESIRQLSAYAEDMAAQGNLGTLERGLVQVAAGEYLSQIYGGIKMDAQITARLEDMGLDSTTIDSSRNHEAVRAVMAGNSKQARAELAHMIKGSPFGVGTIGQTGLQDDIEAMRESMERFGLKNVTPFAQEWHLNDKYIPMDIIQEQAGMGTFGLTIPEEFGGLGMGKLAMCVVTEALSRSYIGVGSLGTRTEIAGELILANGTDEQKAKYLPGIASGEILPVAVFTEPGSGSDLASLKTRAVLEDDVYKLTGSKTFITHPVRADVMTVLARTTPGSTGAKGVSMLLADKPRGTDEDPFPAKGMSGEEIGVLGYRGMKEYGIGFDGFEVPADGLLGGEEGKGFAQLMATFEAARIQTAARAIGVAQSAFDEGLKYSLERAQFGRPINGFADVGDRLVMMAAEIMAARQLTYFAAREKDSGRRCDYEAGMAKLLAARVANASADSSLQIHGGMGYAIETPISRIFNDARVLRIFEGADAVQLGVIARNLLEDPSRLNRKPRAASAQPA